MCVLLIKNLFGQDDDRHYVDLTTFGFFQGGMLDVHMINFMLPTGPVDGEVCYSILLLTF